MTLIRPLQPDEVPVLLEGARMFFDEGKLPGKLNEASFVEGWQKFLASGIGILFAAFEGDKFCGAIGGSVFGDFPTGDLVATEFFWYTLPGKRGSGLRLLRAFEDESRRRGAKRIAMIHLADLNDEVMGKMYERLGYRLGEKIYFKTL